MSDEYVSDAFLMRLAPVPTYEGRTSFALEEFDPFRDLVEELDIVVGLHSTDQRSSTAARRSAAEGSRHVTPRSSSSRPSSWTTGCGRS